MGGSCDHPSPLGFKESVKKILLGKDIELVGSKYDTEVLESGVNVSEGHFTNPNENSLSADNEQSLDQELCKSAMMFCSLSLIDSKTEPEIPEPTDKSLSEEMETEGLYYFGGYIAQKFSQYKFLQEGSEEGNKQDWIQKIENHPGTLTRPGMKFFKQLEEMEKYFRCYHGNTALRAGKDSVKTLTNEITNYIDLPLNVVQFYVKCKVFFRMRILHREISFSRKVIKKMAKLR